MLNQFNYVQQWNNTHISKSTVHYAKLIKLQEI